MIKPLRQYQREACNAFYDHIHEGGTTSLIELATGAGKSLIAATVCKELIDAYPKTRILVLAHRKELIAQNFKEMIALWPSAPAGINSAGIGRRDWQSQIIFGGIQSLHRHSDILGTCDLVIIDEAHLLPRAAQGMYHRLLAALRERKAKMRVLGLTATPFRLDSGRLDRGEGALFEKTVYKYGIVEGLRDGYLTPLITPTMLTEIDTTGVHSRAGEFVNSELEAAAMGGGNVAASVEEMIQKGKDRKKWLSFCVSKRHAEADAAEMKRRGIECEALHDGTPKTRRDDILRAFDRGDLQCISNIDICSTGTNFPRIDLIALKRPTQSPNVAVQQIGRGTRTLYAPGYPLDTVEQRYAAIAEGEKPNCAIFDFARILKTHGPVDKMEPPERKKRKKGEKEPPAPIRICPSCNAIMPLSAAVCEACGCVFPKEERGEAAHDAHADGENVILSTQIKPKWVNVTSWRLSVHCKEGGYPCLRITYLCGMAGIVNEFLPFENPRGRGIAHRRWIALCGDRAAFVPQTAREAFDRAAELERPARILITRDGKYYRVINSEISMEKAA